MIQGLANSFFQARIEHLFEKSVSSSTRIPFFTHYGDVTDINNLVRHTSPFFLIEACMIYMEFNVSAGHDFEQSSAG